MKYTIEGFNQEFALSLTKQTQEKDGVIEKKIDVIDLVILRWFVDFYPKMSKINVNDRDYAIVQFSYLEKELPLLNISKRAFSDRMRKLALLEVLDYEFYNSNLPTYTFGKNYAPLISSSRESDGGMQKIAGGCSSDCEGVVVQTATYPNTIYPNKEKNIINNILKESVNDTIPVNDEEKEKNNELLPQKKKKKKDFGTLDSLTKVIIDTLGNDEDIIRELQEFIKMRNAKNKQLTDYAMKLTCNKLLKLSREKEKQIAIIQQSIIRNWEELYDIKDDFSIVKQQKTTSKLPEYKYYE